MLVHSSKPTMATLARSNPGMGELNLELFKFWATRTQLLQPSTVASQVTHQQETRIGTGDANSGKSM